MKEGSRNGASLFEGLHEEKLEGGSFTGDPERYVKYGSGSGWMLPYGPRFEVKWRDALFLGPFREGKISYLGEFL